MNVPAELKYTKSHEWVRLADDGLITVGITDHAQDLLGDLVFLELPEVGARLKAGDEAGVVESVKAAADIYAPVAGEVVAINQDAADKPESVNADAYGAWLFRVRPDSAADLDKLLDAAGYEEHVDSEDH